MEYDLLTNSELTEKLKGFNTEYEKCQVILQETYNKMVYNAEEYNKIRKILDKREGKKQIEKS